MLDLTIITGASRGIGKNIAINLAPHSKNIIAISSSNKLQELKLDCNFNILQADLADYKLIELQIAKNLPSNTENISSLGIVLCGARLGETGGIFSSNLDDWEKTFRCNVLGNISVIKGCERLIKSGTKTRVIFFAGGGSCYGYPQFSGYSLSKTSVVRQVENIALELKDYNFSICGLAPGAVETDMLAEVVKHGGDVKTKTSINEPTNFVRKFLLDEVDSRGLNGRLLHVRDDIQNIDFSTANPDLFKLRRVQ